MKANLTKLLETQNQPESASALPPPTSQPTGPVTKPPRMVHKPDEVNISAYFPQR